MTKKIGLIILDGWGIGDKSKSDAIFNARTPFMDQLMAKYPSAELLTSGENVGLPEGQMGNSEVGHLNIGAGRIVYQELTRINKSIRDGEFFKNPVLTEAFQRAKDTGKSIHFMGLVSNGGVHSSQDHLHALCKMAVDYDLQNVFIHAFTDGRDCDPKSGLHFIEKLESEIENTPIQIASVIGRYFAMDRDNRWGRIKKAYDLLINRTGSKFKRASDAVKSSYVTEITDEFVEPAAINIAGERSGAIEEGDIVISFNFRTDRPREISIALTQRDIEAEKMQKLDLAYYTMTNYDRTFENVKVIFEKDNLVKTIGEVVSDAGLTQVRIAETEKYPHVTFFFSGGREKEFEGEKRLLVNSPKVATYDLQPEMSAPEVRDRITNNIRNEQPDFICLNFANPDMVGHTGVYSAIITAVETIDRCLKDVVHAGQEFGYEFIVIADHGNADYAVNPDGSPNTAHSLNPVPVVLVTEDKVTLKNGILADVAPTILSRLGVEQPTEMTGATLVN
ncbi:MAG: 2,3-bisphosphoglycerate-independent phosphoglycerate mutase [Crocinitomicaceae bacterium]|nr:2,3-bisphosphoglycerate-independent phosphoglycerate mutase [Flavobacteriales bacterium]NQZ35884.1 2,3-bisphosphoglycerate-independent phosphoglycerate mutase [Crocinitomicaceae bacterium]